MAQPSYDTFAAFARVVDSASEFEKTAFQVVVWHLALEREIDAVVKSLAARSPKLGQLGFINKAKLLHSLWKGDDLAAEKLYNVLDAFNSLRNKVAHGNEGYEKSLTNLKEAYFAIEPDCEGDPDFGYIVQGVCAFMGKGIMPAEFVRLATALDDLVNEKWPASFGEPRRP